MSVPSVESNFLLQTKCQQSGTDMSHFFEILMI